MELCTGNETMTVREQERIEIAAYIMKQAKRWREKCERADAPEIAARMDPAAVALATVALDVERGAHIRDGTAP
ncbi:hypothetical protein [Sphingomonas oryzagri]